MNSEIRDLNVILGTLAEFPHLEELNLSSNPFTKLPQDLSSLHSVVNFNIMNINFLDFKATVKALNSMPNLKSLYVNMTEED